VPAPAVDIALAPSRLLPACVHALHAAAALALLELQPPTLRLLLIAAVLACWLAEVLRLRRGAVDRIVLEAAGLQVRDALGLHAAEVLAASIITLPLCALRIREVATGRRRWLLVVVDQAPQRERSRLVRWLRGTGGSG
jgi:hypothetical protein